MILGKLEEMHIFIHMFKIWKLYVYFEFEGMTCIPDTGLKFEKCWGFNIYMMFKEHDAQSGIYLNKKYTRAGYSFVTIA